MPAENEIDPTASVSAGARLGRGNKVGRFAVIRDGVELGDHNFVGSFVTLGEFPQHSRLRYEFGDASYPRRIVVGNGNVIREYATVHYPTEHLTSIGNDAYLMAYAHVSHDTAVGDGCVISNACQIGGHSIIMAKANLGLGTIVHPRSTIGGLAMLGMGSIVRQDVPPFAMAVGNPARVRGVNRLGLERHFGEPVPRSATTQYLRDPAGGPDSLPEALRSFAIAFAAASRRPVLKLGQK